MISRYCLIIKHVSWSKPVHIMMPCLLKRSVIWCHHVLVLKSVLPLIEKFSSKGHPIKFYWTHDIEDLFSVFPDRFISSFLNWYDIYWQSRPEILDCQPIFNNWFYCPFTTTIFILFSIRGIELWVCFSLGLFLLLLFLLKVTFFVGNFTFRVTNCNYFCLLL